MDGLTITFTSALLSTIAITCILWYTTEKENDNWVVLFKELNDLHQKIDDYILDHPTHVNLNCDLNKLQESVETCLDLTESKIDNDHYYNQNGIEAWDIIKQVMDFHEGKISNNEAGILYNMMKYLLRFPYKGQFNSDLDKICVYAQELKRDE